MWTINPTIDPVHTWNGYDICIHTQADNGVGLSDVTMLYAVHGSNNWQSMGNSDGEVWSAQSWEADVAAKGGFKPWFTALLTSINARIATWAATIAPQLQPAQVAVPATFTEFQHWLKPLNWTDSQITTTASK